MPAITIYGQPISFSKGGHLPDRVSLCMGQKNKVQTGIVHFLINPIQIDQAEGIQLRLGHWSGQSRESQVEVSSVQGGGIVVFPSIRVGREGDGVCRTVLAV